MGVYSYNVRHNDVFYKAGEYVPDDAKEVKIPEPEEAPVPGPDAKTGAKPKGRPPKKK